MPFTPESRSKLALTSLAAVRNAASCSGVMPSTLNASVRSSAMFVKLMLRVGQQLAQPLHLGLALDAQRIVGLDAQHEMDAALEVETELEQRSVSTRAGDAVAGRDDRIDPDRGEDDGDGDDGEEFPAQIGHMTY